MKFAIFLISILITCLSISFGRAGARYSSYYQLPTVSKLQSINQINNTTQNRIAAPNVPINDHLGLLMLAGCIAAVWMMYKNKNNINAL